MNLGNSKLCRNAFLKTDGFLGVILTSIWIKCIFVYC